jgi:hypothetical protein
MNTTICNQDPTTMLSWPRGPLLCVLELQETIHSLIYTRSSFSKYYLEVNSRSILIIIVLLYDKHFENIQAKHKTELISLEIHVQCFDSTFVDKLFKSVFK